MDRAVRVRKRKRRRPPVVIAVLLPLVVGGADVAGAEPGPPAGGAASVDELVPGVPQGPYQQTVDTPDQALPPMPRDGRRAEAAAAGPSGAGGRRLIEYVAPEDARPDREPPGPEECTARTGPYQREVERHLRLKVDGKQSDADCEAIRAWQLKKGLEPAIGFAGPTSWAQIRIDRAAANPNAEGYCPVIPRVRVACVDLSRQLMWVHRGGKVVHGPVPVRTGRRGYTTRTGMHRIYWRNRNHVSSIYKTPMPFSQFFNGGQAFHAIDGDVFDPRGGSHGCVNLTRRDAQELWTVLRLKDRVFVWGRRPGT